MVEKKVTSKSTQASVKKSTTKEPLPVKKVDRKLDAIKTGINHTQKIMASWSTVYEAEKSLIEQEDRELLDTLAIKAATSVADRAGAFTQVAGVLSKYKSEQIRYVLHYYWSAILANNEKWVGDLLMAPDYRFKKESGEPVYRDINFAIREYFAWCVLYPKEMEGIFKLDDKGNISYGTSPKVRLMDREIERTSTKDELGVISYTTTAPKDNKKLSSGLTWAQARVLFEYLVVGLFVPTMKLTKENGLENAKEKATSNDKGKTKPNKTTTRAVLGKTDTNSATKVIRNKTNTNTNTASSLSIEKIDKADQADKNKKTVNKPKKKIR